MAIGGFGTGPASKSATEAGGALAAGQRVFVVSSYERGFAGHPRCRRFNTLAEAVEAVMAGAKSSRFRASVLAPCLPETLPNAEIRMKLA